MACHWPLATSAAGVSPLAATQLTDGSARKSSQLRPSTPLALWLFR
jgi:hypothetical protein